MNMNKQPLSELSVKNLLCPAELLHLEFFDSEVVGLYVDVLRSGLKSYRLRFRNNKLLKIVTLGHSPNITLKQARALAKQVLLKVIQGEVAAPLLDSLAIKVLSIEDFFNLNYLPFVKSYKRSWSTDVSMIKNHIVPKLGSLEMGKVTPPQHSPVSRSYEV
jgi:hypothetical protein